MSQTTTQIAEAFSRHEFEKTYAHLLDGIQWNLVGSERITDKENVIRACEQSAHYLASVTTNFSKFTVIADETRVVIDSVAEYVDEQQNKSSIASCDIYEFLDGKLATITSYTIPVD